MYFLEQLHRICPGFHPYNIQKKIQILTNQWLQGDRARKFKYSKSVFFKFFFLFWSTKRKNVFCFAPPSSIELGKTISAITTITTATTGVFFSASILFSTENVISWPMLTILPRIYALFGVVFTGLNNEVAYKKLKMSGMTIVIVPSSGTIWAWGLCKTIGTIIIIIVTTTIIITIAIVHHLIVRSV